MEHCQISRGHCVYVAVMQKITHLLRLACHFFHIRHHFIKAFALLCELGSIVKQRGEKSVTIWSKEKKHTLNPLEVNPFFGESPVSRRAAKRFRCLISFLCPDYHNIPVYEWITIHCWILKDLCKSNNRAPRCWSNSCCATYSLRRILRALVVVIMTFLGVIASP